MKRFALLLLALLCACAATPPARAPRHEAAADALQRAQVLYQRGEFEAALKQGLKAYDLAASIEDEDAVAAALINLSTYYQRLGRAGEARATVEQVLQANMTYPAGRVAEAALRRAVLAAEDGDAEAAAGMIARSEKACNAPCPLTARYANLRAQIAIERNDPPTALAQSGMALAEARRLGEEEEAANALRLTANALIVAKRSAESIAPLTEALAIDKRLGASRKVYRDLLLLGIAERARGDEPAAQAYLRRAQEVARADGAAAAVQESAAWLAGKLP